ncbi:hypothetical protein [Halococcus agarilyticus]|uniref:hypothetical protein n=1 Tax=Halococcus agarilyticus TaxID=1232219 RepID=UPI000677F1A7|nr:hypothetical protein [Halococcus agarilyticus]
MDRGPGSLLLVLKITVYAVTMIIGSTVLIADPTAKARFLPVVAGIAVLLHAVHRGNLRPAEYSILGLYGTVLGVVVVTVATTTSAVEVPNVVTADTAVSCS